MPGQLCVAVTQVQKHGSCYSWHVIAARFDIRRSTVRLGRAAFVVGGALPVHATDLAPSLGGGPTPLDERLYRRPGSG